MSDIKKMTPAEFRDLGYLQELNRRFLHPLGLALEVKVDEHGVESFGDVWDYRDDPEGMLFDDGMIDAQKAIRIHAEGEEKYNVRHERYGWYTQPFK
jgi:hypothetical protein